MPARALQVPHSGTILQPTGVGKSRFAVVHMEKDMQVMIITIALLTQKYVTMVYYTNKQIIP